MEAYKMNTVDTHISFWEKKTLSEERNREWINQDVMTEFLSAVAGISNFEYSYESC